MAAIVRFIRKHLGSSPVLFNTGEHVKTEIVLRADRESRKPHIANGVASEVQPSQEWNRHKRTQRSPRDDGHKPEASLPAR